MKTKRNTKLVHILLFSRMLYALLILFSVLLIVVLINGLYQHNHEILHLDYTSVYGALPQKLPFGYGMAFSAQVSLQAHGVNLKQQGQIIPNLKVNFKSLLKQDGNKKFLPQNPLQKMPLSSKQQNPLQKMPLPSQPIYEPHPPSRMR